MRFLHRQDGHLLDSTSQKFAFRRAVIVQDELEGQEGRSFLFEINNIRIFCGGKYLIYSPLLCPASHLIAGV